MTDYEFGPLDRSLPERVWLQVDTSGSEEDRSQPLPREHWDVVTWCWESIGGQEVVYVRADLVAELLDALRPFAGATLTRTGAIVGLMREDFERAEAAIAKATGASA